MARDGKAPSGIFFRELALVFFGALCLSALTSLLSYHLERQLILRTNDLLRISMAWSQVASDAEAMETALESCLVAGDGRTRETYRQLAGRLEDGIMTLAKVPSLHRDVLAIEDVQGMARTMTRQGLEAIEAQGSRAVVRSNERFREASATGEYLRDRVHLAVMDLLRRESGMYRRISARLGTVSLVALLLIPGGLVLAMLVLAAVSYRITRPLGELAAAAERVSRGDFSQPVPVRRQDEVGHVAKAFNRMALNLARLIEDLREKSALEVRLRESEVENLAMQNLLQETRLQALQAQTNPHFLFNTLNVGAHLANLENAERTAAFLECAGRIFRYTLHGPDLAVALEEEIGHAEDYVALLHMRYGEQAFTFSAEIEPGLYDVQVPRLILQPLVENAYLHGLADRAHGSISVRAYRAGAGLAIEVADDGAGIPPEAIERALLPRAANNGSSGAIGLANLVARLRLWTGLEQPVEFLADRGRGTIVRLHLPERE